MIFGRKRATVAAPSIQLTAPTGDSPDTIAALDKLRPEPASDVVQLRRDVQTLADELVWQRERFDKLQNRVTAELREVRREVDRLYEQPEEDDGT
jgi:hypothetical protein